MPSMYFFPRQSPSAGSLEAHAPDPVPFLSKYERFVFSSLATCGTDRAQLDCFFSCVSHLLKDLDIIFFPIWQQK